MTSKPKSKTEFQFYRDEIPDRVRAYFYTLERSSKFIYVKNRPRSREFALKHEFIIKNGDGEFITERGKQFLEYIRAMPHDNVRKQFPERPSEPEPEVVTKKPKRQRKPKSLAPKSDGGH